MPVEEHPKAKRLRITMCVLFVLNIVCLALPYAAVQEENTYRTMTAIQMIFGADANDGRFIKMALLSSLFLILPLAGFLTASFDKHRNIKCIVGFLSSVGGIVAIIYMIGPQYVSIGATLALLLYIVSALCSTMMFMTNLAIENESRENKDLKK